MYYSSCIYEYIPRFSTRMSARLQIITLLMDCESVLINLLRIGSIVIVERYSIISGPVLGSIYYVCGALSESGRFHSGLFFHVYFEFQCMNACVRVCSMDACVNY